jgi:RNA polymerase sigma-70 factor (ECF subfamily)
MSREWTLRRRGPEPEIDASPSASPTSETPPARVPTWEEVARDYGRFLYTVSFRLTGNREQAEDLVQDVLLRVRKGLASYQPGSMEGWLSRIATNAFLDDVRKRKRRPVEAMPEDPERVLAGAPSADEALDQARLPDDVQQALRDLPSEFRAAVVLCDVVGFSYDEIADSLGVPIGTVRSRIHRGRSMLKEKLR